MSTTTLGGVRVGDSGVEAGPGTSLGFRLEVCMDASGALGHGRFEGA
ncbi:MAG: hypothetical protein HYV07_09455 [Deltaproteobacteria bacterium]|nr:hypothetical protein [Deltaproteobacteria bacterium]